MRAVNLLPGDDRRQRRSGRGNDPRLIGGLVGAVLVTAIIAAWFLTASGGVAKNQDRLDAVNSELASTPVPPPPAAPDSSQLSVEKAARVTALSSALAGRLAWDRVLREISLVLPEDVWLTSLSAQAPSGAAAAAGSTPAAGFAINGKTYSHDGVARLLARLAVVPHLSGVQLQSSTRAISETGRAVVEFSINANVKAAGA